jgi:uncharacterized phage protein (TIGR02218 family)
MSSFLETEASTDSASPRELYLFTQGPREWAFTGADETVPYNGRIYTQATIGRGEIDYSQEDSAGSVTISLTAANPVAQLFIGLLPGVPMYVSVFRVHRNGAAAVEFIGRVAHPVFDGLEASLTCVPLAGALGRSVPNLTYQRQCNWALYGPGCGIDKLTFRDLATLDVVDGFIVRATEFGARPDGWFTAGWVEIKNGDRAGDRRYVTEHAGEQLTLNAPFAALAVGDQVYAFAGCDRSETTCAAKFSNLPRHLGFSRIPTLNPHKGRMS